VRKWKGATVVILASGESLTEGQCELVRQWRAWSIGGDRRVIAINTTFRRAPWCDVIYACDEHWWDLYHAETRQIPAERWTQNPPAATRYGITLITSRKGLGLCREPGAINQGKNGGYQAIGLAYHFAVARVVLLGYDMHGGHWHGEHPDPLDKRMNFGQWLPLFDRLAADLQREGVDVVNCTPGTALTCFRQAGLEEVLAC
jgi:hypothetical protein